MWQILCFIVEYLLDGFKVLLAKDSGAIIQQGWFADNIEELRSMIEVFNGNKVNATKTGLVDASKTTGPGIENVTYQ